MLKKTTLLVAVGLALALQGCTTNLIEGQKQELATYKAKGLAVEEKNPATAAALGILPGAGYFYTGLRARFYHHPALPVPGAALDAL